MAIRANSSDYRRILTSDLPLLDVRAPVEFQQGSFPNALNIPLLDDDQRRAIGTVYKQRGQDAAIALGWKMASPTVIAQRIEAWKHYTDRHPQGYLYCFRGGLRSQLSQQLLADHGIDYPIIVGGYKAMRRYLIDSLEALAATQPFILVGGKTGSGKTELLGSLSDQVDLEGAAHHRGSAFGGLLAPQPSQIDFENAISARLIKLSGSQPKEIFLEDEGKLIGRLNLPLSLRKAMQASSLIILEAPLGERISRIVNDYVIFNYAQLLQGKDRGRAIQALAHSIASNLNRIKKRLGGARHDKVLSSFRFAINELDRTGSADFFRPGIQLLLTEYYDPMYRHQLSQRHDRILFSGSRGELLEWIAERRNIENT